MVWANLVVLAAGGVLLTLPIVLHLLMQPKPKVLEFPALRFVQTRQLKSTRRVRLRHIILLLLRCLLIAILAAALAGPSVASREFGQWLTLSGVGISALIVGLALAAISFGSVQQNKLLIGVLTLLLLAHLFYGAWGLIKLLNSKSSQLIGDSEAPVTALMLVDTSCRMEYRHENQSRLQKAQELCRWLIEQLPSDSQVCVCSTDSDPLFYSVDLGAAKNRIDNLEIDYASSTIPGRLAEGLELLRDAIHERREIYILTDMTRKSWESPNAGIRQKIKQVSNLSLFVVDVGQTGVQNFMIGDLELNRTTVTQDSELVISSIVSRLGPAEQRNLRCRLERPDPSRPVILDRQVLLPENFIDRTIAVDIPHDGTVPIEFRFTERLQLGTYHGSVDIIGEDSLNVDNRRYFTIEVREPWNILVVQGRGVSPENVTESLADDGEASLYHVTLVNQSDIPSNLEKFQAVLILDPNAGMTETTWNTLRQYVESGHGLAICLGANAASGPEADISFHSDAAQQVLTGKLLRQWRRPDGDLFLSPESLNHPIFAPFRNWQTAVPWGDFPIYYHWSIEPDERWESTPTQTILRFGNTQPAIIERQIGGGRVLVLTTPLTEPAQVSGRERWNDLFIGYPLPAWLLTRQLAEYLTQSQADRLNLQVGEIAFLKNDPRRFPKEYRIFTPRTNQAPGKVTAVDGTIRYRFTETSGQYRLKGTLAAPALLRGFSVNLASGQTDLSRVDPADIDVCLGEGQYQLATRREQIQRQQGSARRGQEFYPLLILLLLVILGVENVFANRFYR